MGMISLQIQIFILMAIGYILTKRGHFSKSTRGQLTNIVFLVILPSAIIRSFQIELDASLLTNCLIILAISLGIQLMYAVINKFLYNNYELSQRICCQYSTMVSNSGFMGLPIAYGIFGDEGLLYASFFLIPIRVFMWSSGLSLFTKSNSTNIARQVLTHPCIIAVYIGFVVMAMGFVGISLPGPIDETLGIIARSNTAICMLIIGGILGDTDDMKILDFGALLFSFYRLIMLPLIVLGAVRLLPINPLIGNVCVLLSAMPAGSSTAMLAQRYDGNTDFASKLVFVSTLLSLVTLPLITFVFNQF